MTDPFNLNDRDPALTNLSPGNRSMKKARKLYSSPNGDRWYLIREASGSVFVRHEANLASGGHVAHIEIGEFLSTGQGPEQQELLRLIGTLVDEHPVDS